MTARTTMLETIGSSDFDGRIRLLAFPSVVEQRGTLVELGGAGLPFLPRRSFVVTDVPAGTVRGRHAHKECEQVLTCLRGHITVEMAYQERRTVCQLHDPSVGLYIGAGVWSSQTYRLPESILLVLASMPFDPASYVDHSEE